MITKRILLALAATLAFAQAAWAEPAANPRVVITTTAGAGSPAASGGSTGT